jgi:hypothetical protein
VRRLSDKQIAILDRAECLPDSVAIGIKTAALMTSTSVGTWRRNPPVQTFFIGKKLAANLGAVRRLTKGELARPPPDKEAPPE